MKKIAGNWNGFEIFWLVIFTLIAIGFTIVSKDSFLGFTVFITGVLCVVLTAKGKLLSYVFGMYKPSATPIWLILTDYSERLC